MLREKMIAQLNTPNMSHLDGKEPRKSYDVLEAIRPGDMSSIIQMAWEDHISFDHIQLQYGIKEPVVIKLMRRHLKPSSFKLWRKRVTNRKTKHLKRKLILWEDKKN